MTLPDKHRDYFRCSEYSHIIQRGGWTLAAGPGPTLSLIMAEAGWPMALYDLVFPDERVLEKTYDLITATEVIEHIHQPAAWLSKLWSMIKPGEILAFMTKLMIDKEAFSRWQYKNEPTYACYYSEETFQYLVERSQVVFSFEARDVAFFYKSIHLIPLVPQYQG
ncbi:class I SAM-dependent methyltransferase [Endozoicomonas sp. ONNA1]|uniref:class I SAM-dependent methyltransferase n=1 Tax=Endozoicomonas sp. ONNA1 TaxID=2828740 RepID=UPI002147BA80|nr:class I SAM-dependent methyltransferase [Endozoicomonas sp. ONNA1]